MDTMKFKAYAITNEIDLNKIAIGCGIAKKYTWEEPLRLGGEVLGAILDREIAEDQNVFVFSFGSLVLINCLPEDTQKLLHYIKKIKPELDIKNYATYNDDYELHVDAATNMTLTDEYVVIPHFEIFYPELVSTIIAKSVALEKTEAQLSKILDTLENTIDKLEKGNLRISDKKLAKTTSQIVRHEYNTIAYIMILDKPDITWINSDAALFYEKMSDFFELTDRYEILKQKTQILNNLITGFSSISHSIKGLFVEWVIVILILVEIVLMVAEFFK